MIYVDPLMPYGWVMYGKHIDSCHLFTDDDNLDELHKIASAIGLKRNYFQNKKYFPHYDLVESKRIKAVKLGVKEVSLEEMVNISKKLKNRK